MSEPSPIEGVLAALDFTISLQEATTAFSRSMAGGVDREGLDDLHGSGDALVAHLRRVRAALAAGEMEPEEALGYMDDMVTMHHDDVMNLSRETGDDDMIGAAYTKSELAALTTEELRAIARHVGVSRKRRTSLGRKGLVEAILKAQTTTGQ
jgi:hypothetical protein